MFAQSGIGNLVEIDLDIGHVLVALYLNVIALDDIESKMFDMDDLGVLGVACEEEVLEFLSGFLQGGGEVIPGDHGILVHQLLFNTIDIASPFLGFGEQPFLLQYLEGKLDLPLREACLGDDILLTGN